MSIATAVFIDYDNLFRSINEFYSQFKTNDVVKLIIGHLEERGHSIKLVKAFCDFKSASEEISDLQENLVELRHVNSIGDGKTNASDIALAVDVIKSLYNDRNFKHYAIVSSDSDMLPLLLELTYQDKDITLLYLESNVKRKYLKSLERKINIIKIEDILQVKTYNPFDIGFLEHSNENKLKCLNCINRGMNQLFEKYGSKPKTAIYQSNILEFLNKDPDLNFQPSDSSIILDYFKRNQFILMKELDIEIKGTMQTRSCYFINEKKLDELGLTLDEEVKVKFVEEAMV